METTIRSLRPDRRVYDSGSTHWRGGQVIAIGANITIKFHREAHIIATQVVSTSLVPLGARSLGCPLAVRVDEAGTIVEVLGSSFGADAPRNGSFDANAFHPGIVPRSITNEPLVWWEG